MFRRRTERGVIYIRRINGLVWFAGSPDAGRPECLCSICETVIPEDEFPFLRLFVMAGESVGGVVAPPGGLEARFHRKCIPPELGIVWPQDDEALYDPEDLVV